MKALEFIIGGNWGHFKRPETNNNPLTHDFITKTALIGLIGAVTGKERSGMRALFPVLSEDILYGVHVVNAVKKEPWGFTFRRAVNLYEKAPKSIELLKRPKFRVMVALLNSRSESIFKEFSAALQAGEAIFTPVLGLHNCPADLSPWSSGEFSSKRKGSFITNGFVSRHHRLDLQATRQFRIGFERIPTYQTSDFWNLPDKYVEVAYPCENQQIAVDGEHYDYSNGEQWWLI